MAVQRLHTLGACQRGVGRVARQRSEFAGVRQCLHGRRVEVVFAAGREVAARGDLDHEIGVHPGRRGADALADDHGCWIEPKRARSFLFPVHALSRVFRGKFTQALAQAGELAALPRDPADTALARAQRVQALHRHDWVVYAKTPLAGPAAVLDYLARYTHRTAIGNERLVAIAQDKVLLRVRADATGGKRVIAMPGEQFIGRLLQHVLPPGFKRIRHYGLLAPAAKTERLATAHKLLAMPAANPQAREDAKDFMRRVAGIDVECCPHCRLGRWRVVEQRGADRAAIAAPTLAACRGPP